MTRADRDHRTYTGVYALYIHVPFCRIRCTYCAFNTYAGQEDLINDYVAALVKEIYLAPPPDQKLRVATLYFGGGTPSLLASHHIETILAAVQKRFEIEADFEVTLEANPGTIDRTKLQALHALGITRLSLGMQSAHQSELTLFGRLHQHKDVVQAVEDARQA
ncbi:MAG: radical SAM protein, partial [Chloroflexi bacterium]|nr:radical SAM protein [Chloroflexota bacterium]